MQNKVAIELRDRFERVHLLRGEEGQTLSSFLTQNYIPRDAVLAKVEGAIVDDDQYVITRKRHLVLEMVRAYQLPEFCRMLQLWEDETNARSQDVTSDSIYTKKVLWFNENGICNLKYSNFNRTNFVAWLENNFVEGILSKNLISENEEICLALSGGRDSLALLYLLQRNKQRLPKFKLVGVTVSDSAASPRDVKVAKEAMESLGAEDYTILPLEYLEETMGYKYGFEKSIEASLKDGGRGRSISMWHCVMRANVERFARERQIKKIAFGYQFEDLMASVFREGTLGVLFGEMIQKKKWGEFFIISPLWTITKKELTVYLELVAPRNHSRQGSPTDYDRGDHNRDINYFMADLLSAAYPGIGFSMFESLEQLNTTYAPKQPTFYKCKNCNITYNDRYMHGTLISKDYCDHCLYLMNLGHIRKLKLI